MAELGFADGQVRGMCAAGRNLRFTESRPDGIYAWRISWTQTTADDTVVHACAVCMAAST